MTAKAGSTGDWVSPPTQESWSSRTDAILRTRQHIVAQKTEDSRMSKQVTLVVVEYRGMSFTSYNGREN